MNCPGYEPDLSIPCTSDKSVASRNDVYMENPDSVDWCYSVCDKADFSFGLTIPQYVWIIAAVNIVSIPSEKFMNDVLYFIFCNFNLLTYQPILV